MGLAPVAQPLHWEEMWINQSMPSVCLVDALTLA